MIDDLELTEVHADAIVDKGIEYDVFSDDKPESKKDIMEAAHNIVSMAIDAWVEDEVRPGADDKDVAAAGEQVQEILELAGVSIDKKNNIEYGELPELEGVEETGGDDGDGDGEAAFDINDVIEGYEELTAASKVKKIKELELDVEDENDANTMIGIAQWEMAQDSPSSRVLNYLGEFLDLDGAEGGGDEEPAEEPEAAGGDDDDADGEGDTYDDEPWDGYDAAKVTDIKKTLTEAAESEDEDERLTAEQVEYVIGYEESHKNRDGLLKWLRDIIDESGDDDETQAEEPEAEPAKTKSSRAKKAADPDDDFTVDEDDISSVVPSGLAGAFVESKLHEERVRKSGLAVPSEWEGDVPELPEDIGAVDHDELSNLMLRFQAALSTASWFSATAYIRADIMEDIADYLEQRAILASEESNDTKRKAEAKTDARVVAFRGLQKTAYHDYVRYRDLARDFEGKVKVVSRVGGFKDEDDAGSDARPQSAGSAKGTAKASSKGESKPSVGRSSKPSIRKK